MTVLHVGSKLYPDITAALADAIGGDILKLKSGYSHDAALITVQDLFVSGDVTSSDIDLTLGDGVSDITLLGGARINVTDNAGSNTITGNNGRNVIEVTGGNDIAHGGGGHDRLIINYADVSGAIIATVTEAGDGGTNSVTYDGFENLTLYTGSGNDTVTTGEGDDKVRTGAGNDTITIGGGHSIISSGAGNDTVTTGDGGDNVNGGRGDDSITTGQGRDFVNAGAGNDTVNTLGGADHVVAKSGVDVIDMGAGKDLLEVNLAHSTADVTAAISAGTHGAGYSGLVNDVEGNSITFTGVENFIVIGGHGDDDIATGAGHDVLKGRDGDDLLNGGNGHDQLSGDLGADTVIGGRGQDEMSGGDGADTFSFFTLRDSNPANMDVISDLQGVDTIDVSAIDADRTQAGNQAFTLVGAFSNHAGEATFLYDAGSDQTVLSLDVDGDGVADFALAASGDQSSFSGFTL